MEFEAERGWYAYLNDLKNLKFHGAAWGFDTDGFSDAGFHKGIAHGTGGRDGKDIAFGAGGLGFADELNELLGVIGEVEELDGVAEEDHVFGNVFVGNHGGVFQLGFQLGQLALDGAVFFFGEVVLGIF